MMDAFFIATPSYNAADTILETIRSVLRQKVECPIVYHIQDGASTDGTQDILRKVAAELLSEPELYGNITFSWVSEPDGGMYDAIAKAFASMRIPPEAFMGWINADDVLTPGCLSLLQDAARRFPWICWCGGQPCSIGAHGLTTSRPPMYWPNRELFRSGLCDGIHFPCVQQEGMFWRQSLFEASGGLNVHLRLAGDWDLWRRMAEHAPFVELPRPTGIFRSRPGQLSEDTGQYRGEIASILSKKARQGHLRIVFRRISTLCFSRIREDTEGTLFWEEDRPALKLKHKIRIFCASRGWYWIMDLYRVFLKMLRWMNT